MTKEGRSLHVGRDDTPFVISSEVERSALPLGLSKKSHEISPLVSLGRDDNKGHNIKVSN